MLLPASPISGPSRRSRPPFLIVVLALAFSVLSFHALYYGVSDTSSSLLSYTSSANPFRSSAARDSWLILTMVRANHYQRRHIMRNTWQKLYGGRGLFDAKFVIADPGSYWRALIEQENATYGDIIMLEHEHETKKWAGTVKTMEAFRHVVENSAKPYTFVSKLDEDSFLDARTFHDVWLAPRVVNGTVPGTYIGRKRQYAYPFKFADGQFYTLSWDLVTRILELWDANPIDDEHEDVLNARLLYEAEIRYNITTLPPRAAFDYDREGEAGDGTAWANPLHFVDTDSGSHAIAAGSVIPAGLDDDGLYLAVAGCYDEDGISSTHNEVDWRRYMTQEEGWTTSVNEYMQDKFGVSRAP